MIIAFHQYWSSVAAVMISLFGWILALRGLVLMAAPELYERAAASMETMALSHLCGLARQARLTIGEEQSLSKVDDSEDFERGHEQHGWNRESRAFHPCLTTFVDSIWGA